MVKLKLGAAETPTAAAKANEAANPVRMVQNGTRRRDRPEEDWGIMLSLSPHLYLSNVLRPCGGIR
jgi:hypothetical protein